MKNDFWQFYPPHVTITIQNESDTYSYSTLLANPSR